MRSGWFLAGILFIGLTPLWGQNNVIDSLKSILPQARDFKTKVTIQHKIASELWDYNFEEGLFYAKQAYTLSEENNYPQGQVESLTDIGMYYYFTGNYPLAKENYEKALRIAGENNFGEYPAYTYIRIGNLFRVQSEFDSARKFYEKAEEYLKGARPNRSHASLFHNLGLLNYELGNFRQAIPQFHKSLYIRQMIKDSLLIAESWKQLGISHAALSNIDSSEFYFAKVIGMANRMNDPELSIFYYLHHGDLLFSKGSFLEATNSYLKATDLLATHDFLRYRAMVYKSIGSVFEWQGDYPKALEYFLNSLKINEKLNSKQEIGRIYNSIGWIYINQGDPEKAIAYCRQSLQIMKSIKDRAGEASSQTLYGFILNRQNKSDQALLHYDTAIIIREAIGAQLPMVTSISFRAEIYSKQGRTDLALADLKKVISINNQFSNKIGLARAYNLLATIYFRQGNYQNAIAHTMLSRELAQQIKSIPELRKSYLTLANIYKKTNQNEKAIQTYDRYISISDSLLNAESLQKQAQMSVMYQLEKKENEIQLLNQENLVKQGKLEIQDEKLKFQNSLLTLLIVSSVLLSALAYVLFLYSRSKKRANADLLKLNHEVHEKNEEIQTQSEELVEANEILSKLNHELIEKQEEVKSQSEELVAANEVIHRINRDLEETVRRRTEQLQLAYTELDTFFYRSSHDFRRPLTTFLGLAEVASITVKDTIALELFSKVKETAESLDKMLFKLQSISDAGSQQLVFKEVRLKEMIYEVLDQHKKDIDHKKIKSQVEYALSKPLRSNPSLIKIIIENLVENAIQFNRPEDSIIKIRVAEQNQYACLTVMDNGQGIPYEYQDRIFEMYFRANENSKGNGLGLYIVKKAIERLNGQIDFKSKPYEGATFTMNIPLNGAGIEKNL